MEVIGVPAPGLLVLKLNDSVAGKTERVAAAARDLVEERGRRGMVG